MAVNLRVRRRAVLPVLLVLVLAGCASSHPPAVSAPDDEPRVIECVPFARALSGLDLYGAAADWWWQADGRYTRTSQPVTGSVLVFSRSSRLAHGHVAVVSQVVSDREIRVTHANWVRHRVTRDAPVWDVSADNDWSLVRVWWPPTGQMGSGLYPTEGFILAQPPAWTAARHPDNR
jgi:hypothetical protein